MKKGGGGADNFLGPPLGQRPVWSTDGPDYECDCPGPPPHFYLPPPPRPTSLPDHECSDNSISPLETCKAVPVIDSEYRYSPVISSVAIILIATIAVVVFVFIGTFLVVLKKRKARNLFPRKSLRNRCDGASANGVVYEDLTNIRPRTLSPGCPPGQTTLPSIELLDVASYADHTTPVLICPTSPVAEPYNCQDLFNPVYEELSNGSGDRGESNSEGMLETGASEDEFAEDELSLGGEGEEGSERNGKHGDCFLRETTGNEANGRDVDFSDADDRSKFLVNPKRNYGEKEWRMGRGSHGITRKAKTAEKKKVWKNKALPPLPTHPADCSEFNEGFLLRRILQIYPDVTGVTIQYPRGSPGIQLPDDLVPNGADYESLPDLGSHHTHRPKPDIFSTFGVAKSSGKSHNNRDSALRSESGCSNNTSGARSLPTSRVDYRVSGNGSVVLS